MPLTLCFGVFAFHVRQQPVNPIMASNTPARGDPSPSGNRIVSDATQGLLASTNYLNDRADSITRNPVTPSTAQSRKPPASGAASMLARQLKLMRTDKDIPGISCGLVGDDVFEWEVTLMIDDDCRFYGGSSDRARGANVPSMAFNADAHCSQEASSMQGSCFPTSTHISHPR